MRPTRSRTCRTSRHACSACARQRDRKSSSWRLATPSTAAPRRRRSSARKSGPNASNAPRRFRPNIEPSCWSEAPRSGRDRWHRPRDRARGGHAGSVVLNDPVLQTNDFVALVSYQIARCLKRINVHPQNAVGGTCVKPLGAGVSSGGTQCRVQGQKVLFAWVVLDRERRLSPIVEQIIGLARGERAIKPVGKTVDPIGRRIVRTMTVKFRQIVRQAAAADDQHALLPQRRQGASRAKMVLWSKVRLDRELQ